MTNGLASTHDNRSAENAVWKEIVAKYAKPSTWRAVWQIIDTLFLYALAWYLMFLSLSVSWWLLLPLAVLAGALLVRVFIIFHDCGHGSFFKSRVANDAVGFIAGVLTFTPYYHWRWEHAIHHSSAGDLDRRGTGDVWTLTVQEYLVWMFYVQHQFEGVYWERGEDWSYTAAALQGSSFYKLSRVLQWFSGNIGFHHIHHLSPCIPNYNLERCHMADPLFQAVKPITLFSSMKSFSLRLWDEERKKLVGYGHLKVLRKQRHDPRGR